MLAGDDALWALRQVIRNQPVGAGGAVRAAGSVPAGRRRLGRRRHPRPALDPTITSNEEVAELAAKNADVIIPFASIDPARGKAGALAARRLIEEHGVRGFKFHPNAQAFYPNEQSCYPLYEVLAEHGVIALFHSGHTGVGAGTRGGGGMRLKYSNPMHVDDVAVDFPDLSIILAHPAFPWQDEQLSVAMHKPQVYIDLSGWSPKYFQPQLVQHANTILRHKMLFGSDLPMITPPPASETRSAFLFLLIRSSR